MTELAAPATGVSPRPTTPATGDTPTSPHQEESSLPMTKLAAPATGVSSRPTAPATGDTTTMPEGLSATSSPKQRPAALATGGQIS